MPTTSTDFLRHLEEFTSDSERDLERVQQELREIDVLIRQSTAEVERLAHRKVQVDTKVRQMEANFDTVPRDDIRALYTAAQEAQLRLFMMRSQVEQLQNKQRTLEKYAQDLQRFLDLSRTVPRNMPWPEDDAPGQNLAHHTPHLSITRIIEAQESERQHLARQMHDGPAQSLTNLILQAEICERLFDTDAAKARAELGSLKNAVNTTFQKVRDFIFDLRPMMLDDLGLVPTLRRYVSGFEEKNKIAVHLQLVGKERRLPPPIEVTTFRAIQELLNNASRHARASHIQVTLDISGDPAVTIVEDDGSGFDVPAALTTSRQRTVGLVALKERIELFNGQIAVESSVGRGTRVRIEIPIPAETVPEANILPGHN
ncbi:MAG TPA: histidine kinase [Chloroflexi bacterium]|nr:histidine kinase [Chloroflexota bacterium]